MKRSPAPIRCAIYTRKSTEEGLDQAFNSLHAQREACEAYVLSQAAEGWRALPTIYDDGGFSGGNMDRPALMQLLADVDAGRIDIVVVYKVDRLTRSLADFAKIVERLDAAGASFVSVTQAFNTTTSMGRLTLNVLLSFAQFEREVTGERIRDKIAASKAKGMWMGGNLPLGYDPPADPATRALVVNPPEAETVRYIFATYLELGSVHALAARLEAEGIRSKRRVSRAGREIGGVKLARGALFHLLQNRVYLGEITHQERSYPGAHSPIVEEAQFIAVQERLGQNRKAHKERPLRSATMALKGLLFDVDGMPMSPAFTHGRNGRVYRYYVSSPLLTGRSVRPCPRGIRRVSAVEIEEIVRRELQRLLETADDQCLEGLLQAVARIEIEAEELRIFARTSDLPRAVRKAFTSDDDPSLSVVEAPIRCRLRGGRTWLIQPGGAGGRGPRRDPILIRGLKRAHELAADMGWRLDGSVDAACKAPASAYDRKLCRLAFLAPDIQAAILQGRQLPHVNLESLVGMPLPTSWAEQRQRLGFAES